MMINKEAVTEWVEALESGDYRQGRYTLYQPDLTIGSDFCFCCIGVFGKINGMDLDDPESVYDRAAEVTGSAPEEFWRLNDRLELSFDAIAATIRRDVLGETV